MRFIKRNAEARGRRGVGVSCEEARPLASADLDGEANDLEKAALVRHLRSCTDCRRFAAGASRAQTLAGRERSVPLEARDHEAVVAAARAEAEALHGRRNSGRVPAAQGSVDRALEWLVGLVPRAKVTGRPRTVVSVAAAAMFVLVVSGAAELGSGRSGGGEGLVTLALPQVTAGRTLDPSYVPYLEQDLGGGRLVVAAGTADEKLLFFQSPMSFHEEYHFRPEES